MTRFNLIAYRLYKKGGDGDEGEATADDHGREALSDLKVFCDVEPSADRLVLFFSDGRTPHEVLPTHVDRFAVTVWFWDPVEKSKTEREKASAAAMDELD